MRRRSSSALGGTTSSRHRHRQSRLDPPSHGKAQSWATGPDLSRRTSCACTPTAQPPASARRSTSAGRSGEIRHFAASTSDAHDCVRTHNPERLPDGAPVKWILCPGCDEYRLVHPRARSCSARCRTRLWRRTHGRPVERLAFCAWCQAPLLYLPQDRLPSRRRYCHARCARKAWLVARARRNLTGVAALETAACA